VSDSCPHDPAPPPIAAAHPDRVLAGVAAVTRQWATRVRTIRLCSWWPCIRTGRCLDDEERGPRTW